MIVHEQVGGEAIITNISGVTDMGMKVNAKSFNLMISKLYVKKEDAVVRELGANARDAMNDLALATNTPIQPFSIQLPNDITHELVIRDNGTGLSVENVHKYLGNLFESSKENENNSIGAYGLGSKSPFAVTDSYIIESRHQGQLHSFSFFRAKGGIPQLVHIGSHDTDEPNGITFKVPASPSRYDAYARAVSAQLFFFNPRPNVTGNSDIWDGYGQVEIDTPVWKLIKSYGMKTYYGPILANMGGVSYPVNYNNINDFDTEDEYILKMCPNGVDVEEFVGGLIRRALSVRSQMESMLRCFSSNTVLGLFFNIGDLEIPPSRELIEYDSQTCYHILVALETFMKESGERFAQILKDETTDDQPSIVACLQRLTSIIDWDASGHVAPSIFLDAIGTVKWQINIGGDLPPIVDSRGALIKGKIEVDARRHHQMFKNLSITFPHKPIEREKQERRFYGCDINGVLTPAAQAEYERVTSWFVTNQGYSIKEKKVVKKITSADIEEYDLCVDFEKKYTEYVPALEMSQDIAPQNGNVTARSPNFSGIGAQYIGGAPSADSHYTYGARTTRKRYVILVDVDDRDLRKYGTWALRKIINIETHQGQMSDQKTLSLTPSSCPNYVQFLRGSAEHIEFFKQWNEKYNKDNYIIWKLSELEIPKAERVVGANNLVLRGVKKIDVVVTQYNRTPKNISYGFTQNTIFSSIPSGKDVVPGFMVFSDGKTETTYLDPELTVSIGNQQLVSMMALFYRLHKADLNKHEIKTIYRLTPMNIKNLNKFKEQGFRVLSDYIKQIGLNINGRGQFKRRYKHSILTRALRDSEAMNHRTTDNGDHVFKSVFWDFVEQTKQTPPRIVKHLVKLNRSAQPEGISSPHGLGDDGYPHPVAFGYGYAEHYGPLREDEAMRLAIDFWLTKGFIYHEQAAYLFGDNKKPYAAVVYEHSKTQFRKARLKWLEKHYKEVLFSGYFSRDSDEFSSALEIARKKLMG